MPKVLEDKQIYSAVMQVVAERGYIGATTRQMADAANVSEVTLFRKYGSKQQLVKQALSSIISQTDLASSVQYTGHLNADLTRIVKAYAETAVVHGDFISSLFLEISRQAELLDTIDEPMNIFMSMRELIARYQDQGQLKQGHPMYLVAVLLGPLMYTAMMRKIIPMAELSQSDLSKHVNNFLEGYQTNRSV